MKKVITMFALMAVFSLPSLAQADESMECANDADCPDGMICAIADCKPCPDGEECPSCEPMGECFEVYVPTGCSTDQDCPEGSQCVSMPCACDCKACPEGEECEPCGPCDCDDLGECMPIYEDDPGGWYGEECETDEDCPVEFKCEEVSWGQCGGSTPTCAPCTCAACDPDDESCDPEDCECPPCDEQGEAPECFEETVKMCTFSPTECEADADCGDGFECLAQEICYGYGTACACPDIACACEPCPEGEECEACECEELPPCDCPEEEEYVEECETVGSYCVPRQVACSDDADCFEGWTCEDFGGDCACPMCECMSEDCAEGEECALPEECSCPPCDCSDETEAYCVPAGWKDAGFNSGETMGSADFLSEATGDGEDKGGENQAPETPDPNADTGEEGAESEAPADDAAGGSDGSSGCTAGAGHNSSAGLLFLALLFALAVSRRRFASVVKS